MAKNLLIVESPAKAKTIGKYLGDDFKVKSSFGHIRDLEKEGMGIDIENDFHPRYVISKDKLRVVKELKEEAKKAGEIWLATDEDREGEAISWHLCEVLKLNPKTTKRIAFHEITKPAIQNAIKNPRTVDMDLVMAQQARRVLDRLVGFEISPVLWRKLSGGSSLSAGRVQSVAVRLIVERERAINNFKPEIFYRTEGFFTAPDLNGHAIGFKAEGSKFKGHEDALKFVNRCVGADFTVSNITVKPGKKTPAPPFTTSTLQQEASRKLGMSVSRTMRVAQSLYENGDITYMRTDSVHISQLAQEQAEKEITEHYGPQYHKRRQYKTKDQSAQEAHEAIRPTNFGRHTIPSADGRRLYELIWKRAIASQMSDAITERTTADISISTVPEEKLKATGEVLKFDGFLKVYLEGKDDDDEERPEGMLPPLKVGQQLPLKELVVTQRFSRSLPRFTEASLVKELERLGIGRPSTYAPTISTIQKRGYVERKDREGVDRAYEIISLKAGKVTQKTGKEKTGAEKAKLFPSDLGMVVTDFLIEHFPNVMNYQFTANIESKFDEIAGGKKKWNAVVGQFYGPFHQQVEETMENAERAKGERELGIDPVSGKKVVARLGRFGPMVQIGEKDDEEGPRFASIKKNQSIETITLKEALDLFKVPFDLADYEGKSVLVGVGRFGPYVKWGDQFISLAKGEDPLSVNQERAVELIESKKKADAPVGTFKDLPVTKGVGRFGPFLKWDGIYINVPKAYDFNNLSQEDIQTLIEKKLEKEANRYILKFPEEDIFVENGRWGPFIRVGKKKLSLGKKPDGSRYEAVDIEGEDLEQIKGRIEQLSPGLLKKPTKSKSRVAASRKPATKRKVKPKKK